MGSLGCGFFIRCCEVHLCNLALLWRGKSG